MKALKFTIMVGDPTMGFTLFGNFDTPEEAVEWATYSPHLKDGWWMMPIYPEDSMDDPD